MRIVLDTNILVSSVLTATGPPRDLVDAARAQLFDLCSSPVLMAELFDVLSREKFARRFAQAGLTPMGIVKDIRRMVYMVIPIHVPRVIIGDPDDDHVLACAVSAGANLIVSGDNHLHGVGSAYQGIPIVTPSAAIKIVAAR